MFPVLFQKGHELWFCVYDSKGLLEPIRGPYYKQADGSWK